MNRLILSLCDYSGSWSAPYVEAGYRVVRVDLVAPENEDPRAERVLADVRTWEAPDCPRCGAPHQSTAGCWLCLPDEHYPGQRGADRAWVRLLRAGIRGEIVFDLQDAHPGISFEDAVDLAIKAPDAGGEGT